MIRIVLVDDHELLLRGMQLMFEEVPDIEVVGAAHNGNQALAVINSIQPDVVVTDARMPELDGLGLVRSCRDRHPGIQLLVLTTFEDARAVSQLIDAGASGYLLKDVELDKLVEAIKAVADGGLVLDPRVARFARHDELSILTPAESRVARLVALGMNNREIAAKLFLAEGTVKNHVSQLLRKFDVSDRTQLALKLARAM
ncbi:Transcriptional regulatory protein DegU [Corynebacterium kalinowskii]|uniref:Transcriptional regulatory protein DegU n=1 Tax=Corynebacterium kalinowskii TaxID=2675216 RepID=A0A6B8VYY9_9CORY|nr:response regulator transcription factor [Corynebacterium kalinowskii]QGU02540.1 Transcriptional regulatory protein DegU [Corynebacterium kalinowskii]